LELFCSTFRLRGSIELAPPKRVSDLFNDNTDQLQLSDVEVTSLAGVKFSCHTSFVVQKSEILLALPRETAAYEQARRADRFGLPTPRSTPEPASVLLPPFLVRGQLHLPAPIDWSRVMARLAPFFALTDAVIQIEDGSTEVADVILLNREEVAAFGPQTPD
jgi:hypothetical protein